MKNSPQRTCIGCKQIKDRNELVRLVFGAKIHIDFDKNMPGRGANLCPQLDCLEKCIKSKALLRAFKQYIPQHMIDNFEKEFEQWLTSKN